MTRNGRRVRIADQAARLLSLLLEHRGTMVTREQVKSALWPSGEILEYDQSINRAVSQLRSILRDHSPKALSLIETLHKRGYRLVGEVEEIAGIEPMDPVPAEVPAFLEAVFEPAEPARLYEPTREPEVPAPSLLSKTTQRRYIRWALALTALLLVAAGGGFWLVYSQRQGPTRPISLGIVPFEASGDNATQLAESFRLSLADVLSQSPEIETRAVHSFDHIGQNENQILAHARPMNVDVLIFGKFYVTGGRCQIQLELVRSRDGAHIGTLQYNGALEELAAIGDRIEQDIFDRLRSNGKILRVTLHRPASASAYSDYLRGRSCLLQWTDDSLHCAIASFQAAVAEDPGYARAYAGMASTYFVLAQHGDGDSGKNLDLVQENAQRAVDLDPSLAEAHAMLGQVALNRDWDFRHAEEQLLRAVELDPNHAIYHQWLSILYCLEAKHDLSFSEIDKAHAAAADWAPLYMTEIFLAGSAGRFERADHAADRLLQMMPDWSLAHEQFALCLWAEGKRSRAIAEWRKAAEIERNLGRMRLEDEGAKALQVGGVRAYAKVRLKAIKTRQGLSHEEQDFIPAEWDAYAGNWDQALRELTQMVDDHAQPALQIAADPAYEPLHRNPAFQALIRRIGLPLQNW